jgi:hypothetical protein
VVGARNPTELSTTSTALTFHIVERCAEIGLSEDEIAPIVLPIA